MVSPYKLPDVTSQDPTTYKATIDAAFAVLAKLGTGFAPRAQDLPDLSIKLAAGAVFNKTSAGYYPKDEVSVGIAKPGADSWIARVYIDGVGVAGVVYGAASASPVAPSYPAGCFPVCRITVASTANAITNLMIVDERAWAAGWGSPENTVCISTSGTWVCPANARFLRVTVAGGGGGGGGGYSTAADAAKYGGGGGGGGASVLNRFFNPENLNIVIGAGGTGGANASAAATNDAVAGTAGGSTVVTGAVSGLTFTCAGGAGGARAVSTPANGAGGAGGAAGTGVAGAAGVAGVTNTNGGNGGGVGNATLANAYLSAGGAGAVLASTRAGSPGDGGSGGGGGVGFGWGGGGNGGAGFVLIEIF